jgi:hypothetical protein
MSPEVLASEVLIPQVLALPAPQPESKDEAPTVTKPTLTREGQLPDKAANDDSIPPELVAKIEEFTDESPVELEQLAIQYGFDLVECSRILSREFSRIEVECNKRHGKSRTDMQLFRAIRQQKYAARARGNCIYEYHKSIDSSFSGFWSETEAQMPMLRTRAMGTRSRDVVRSHIFGAMGYRTEGIRPEGELNTRARRLERLKASKRKPRGTFKRTDKYAGRLHTSGARVSTGTQIKAFRTLVNGISDSLRRPKLKPGTKNLTLWSKILVAAGVGPKLRSAELRKQYEDEFPGSRVDYAQRYPNLDANLKSMTTLRILRPASKWTDLDGLPTAQAKINRISSELLKRGQATPLDVTIMKRSLESFMTEGQLDAKVNATLD